LRGLRQLIDGLADQLGLAAENGLDAFEGDAVGRRQRLDVLALRGDRGLDIEQRRLAVDEELAELAGCLVEIRVELGEIRGLEGVRIEERACGLGHAWGLPREWVERNSCCTAQR